MHFIQISGLTGLKKSLICHKQFPYFVDSLVTRNTFYSKLYRFKFTFKGEQMVLQIG